jgi:hypothetical protein
MILQRFKNPSQFQRSCYYALQLHHAHVVVPKPRAAAVISRTFISCRQGPFILRAEEKQTSYKQAKDILKTIEEKQAIDKKNALKEAEELAVKKKKAAAENKVAPSSSNNNKKTLWQKIKAEAVHYWHGTKLLGLEIRISSRLAYKMLQGTQLTRRENRQVKIIFKKSQCDN